VNIGKAYRGAKMATVDDSDKPTTASIYPKPWPIADAPYESQLMTGDLLFKVKGVDGIPDNRHKNRYMNAATVVNLQQLNREIILGKARATATVLDAMQAGRHHIPVVDPEYPNIDIEWLMRVAKQNDEANEFDSMLKVERDRADKIMMRDVAAWEEQVQRLERGLLIDVPVAPLSLTLAREVVHSIWTDYDNHKMTTNDGLARRYHELMNSQMFFLYPQLIRDKYSFIGTVEDDMNASEFHRQVYTRAPGMTVAVRGPAYCTNIFGQPRRKKLRRAPQSEVPSRYLYLQGQLHIVLCTPPDLAGLFRTPDGRGSFHMWPTVAVPTCVTNRCDLVAQLDNDSLVGGPMACYTFSGRYLKRPVGAEGRFVAGRDGYEKSVVHASEGRSWHLGKILEMEDNAPRSDSFYRTAVGCVDYTAIGRKGVSFKDVLSKRNMVRRIKINVKSK